jgi:hypothetical protein
MLCTVKQLLYFLKSGAHSSSDELPRRYSSHSLVPWASVQATTRLTLRIPFEKAGVVFPSSISILSANDLSLPTP